MLLLPSLSVERTMDLISTSFTLRRGSRLPSFTELYYASPANLGNPNLESPDMVEAEWNVAGKNWTVSLWGRHHSDEIEWVSDDGRATFHAVNLEPFFSAGLEFRIRLGTVTVLPPPGMSTLPFPRTG